MKASRSWRIETAKTTSAQAYDQLRRAIIDGEFQPGERLTELGIAALFGVSRTPVREAFARLAKDGLVRSTRGWGIEVVDPRQELVDIYHIREAVEGCAARLAAMRASNDESVRILELAIASSKVDPSDVETRARLNEQFHLAISAASHAPRLERLVNDYRELFATPRVLRLYTPSETRKVLDDHERVAAAIRDRNPDAAEIAMREHLRTAYTLLLKMTPVLAHPAPADIGSRQASRKLPETPHRRRKSKT